MESNLDTDAAGQPQTITLPPPCLSVHMMDLCEIMFILLHFFFVFLYFSTESLSWYPENSADFGFYKTNIIFFALKFPQKLFPLVVVLL